MKLIITSKSEGIIIKLLFLKTPTLNFNYTGNSRAISHQKAKLSYNLDSLFIDFKLKFIKYCKTRMMPFIKAKLKKSGKSNEY